MDKNKNGLNEAYKSIELALNKHFDYVTTQINSKRDKILEEVNIQSLTKKYFSFNFFLFNLKDSKRINSSTAKAKRSGYRGS